MDEKTILEVYKAVGMNIRNQKGYNGKVASRLYNSFFLEPDDLVQGAITHFLSNVRSGKIVEIKNIQKFTSIFTRNYLLDMERKASVQTQIPRHMLEGYRDDIPMLPKAVVVEDSTVFEPEPVKHISVEDYLNEKRK